MRNLLALMVFGLVLSFGFSAYAQTPDEMTPAEETVCDGLEGAAYGLCNAYCEAMDCNGAPEASAKACDKVLQNFINQAGELPPCIIAHPGCMDDSDCSDGALCRGEACHECGLPGQPVCPAGEFCLTGMCVQF